MIVACGEHGDSMREPPDSGVDADVDRPGGERP
jgi:hypothetical protein